MTQITDRIERQLGMPDLAARLAGELEPSDLQSLLLEVYRLRAAGKEAPAVLAEYEANRFVKAAVLSPRRLLEWDRLAFALLPPECESIECSPVCPLGTCSVVAGVAQDWSVSTARNTEVVSDLTNVLALEVAYRRRALLRRDPRAQEPVYLAASQRVLRAQHYQTPKLVPHFRLFALCSGGRGQGALRFEFQALTLHLHFYLSALRAFLGTAIPLRVSVTSLGTQASFAKAVDELFAGIGTRFTGVECGLDPERQSGRGYYQDFCFHIHGSTAAGQEMQLADGGAVNWTQRLLSNAKECLVISGIGSEGVCGLAADHNGDNNNQDNNRTSAGGTATAG